MGFRLTKWYLDVVDDRGLAAVLYWVDLRWGAVRIRAAASLVERAGAGVDERTTIRGASGPKCGAAGVSWEHRGLGCRGEWRREAPPLAFEYPSPVEGGVRWCAEAPAAEVRLEVGGEVRRGRGYAERIEMTVAPWDLGLRELRWGRFVADAEGRFAIWTRWEGVTPLGVVLTPEGAAALATTDPLATTWDGGQVLLAGRRVLRDSPLATGALAGMRMLLASAPRRFLEAHERRDHGPAMLERSAAGVLAPLRGHVIQECVRFACPEPREVDAA